MDAARRLQTAVKETVEIAVSHLFPKVKQLVAEEILRQFEPPLTGLRGPKTRATPSRKKKVSAPRKIHRTKKAAKSRKLSNKQMECRHPGCDKRSMGPKYSFLCKKHEHDKPTQRPNLKVLKGGANGAGSNGLGLGKASKAPPKAAKKAA